MAAPQGNQFGTLGGGRDTAYAPPPKERKDKYPDTMSLMSSSRANQDIKT